MPASLPRLLGEASICYLHGSSFGVFFSLSSLNCVWSLPTPMVQSLTQFGCEIKKCHTFLVITSQWLPHHLSNSVRFLSDKCLFLYGGHLFLCTPETFWTVSGNLLPVVMPCCFYYSSFKVCSKVQWFQPGLAYCAHHWIYFFLFLFLIFGELSRGQLGFCSFAFVCWAGTH